MIQEHPAYGVAAKLTAAPLGVAYVAIPLVTALSWFSQSAVSPFLPWLLIAGLGTCFALLFRRPRVRVKKQFFFEMVVFIALAVLLFLNKDIFLYQTQILQPYVRESTPFIILAFCLLWCVTFGVPDRAAFQRYGAALGILCLVDLAAEALLYQAVPVVRWIGSSDVLAGLLLISLCASLRPGENDGGICEPDEGRPVWRVLILLGIAATLSRSGLFAAGWIFLCFGRGSKLLRTAVLLFFFLLIGGTFLLPTTPSEAARYVDYWLWARSLALVGHDPMILVTGLPFDKALPLEFPRGMAGIWEAATGSSSVMGAYLYQVSPFWLRFILGWGAIVPLVLLFSLFVVLFRRMARLGAGLVVVLFTQGMAAPMLYDPALGVSFGLLLFLALFKPGYMQNVRTSHDGSFSESPSTPVNEVDPVAEWDMRPL